MNQAFHINKYGIPTVCTYKVNTCPYGDEAAHFPTYEAAQTHLKMRKVEMSDKTKRVIDSPIKMIDSYYQSETALNEFPLNKKIVESVDFDLIMISWISLNEVREKMKLNQIGKAQYTYGDIIRILEQEILEGKDYKKGLHLKERYLEGKKDFIIKHTYYDPCEVWDSLIDKQKAIYGGNTTLLAKQLGYDFINIQYLPKHARRLLEKDGYLNDASDIAEVIYKVYPPVSIWGNLVSYNHFTKEVGKEFDVYELVGAIEGKTLYDFTYSKSVDIEFDELWEQGMWENNQNFSKEYKTQKEVFRASKFMKGLEGPDIPKAFVKMSPIAAKEIAEFVKVYRSIMKEVGNIMGEKGIEEVHHYFNKEDDEEYEWKVT